MAWTPRFGDVAVHSLCGNVLPNVIRTDISFNDAMYAAIDQYQYLSALDSYGRNMSVPVNVRIGQSARTQRRDNRTVHGRFAAQANWVACQVINTQ